MFPYAGGSPLSLVSWLRVCPAEWSVFVLQLPGRGERAAEPCVTDFDALLQAVCSTLVEDYDVLGSRSRVVFVGYSFGALLAYEIVCKLRAERDPALSIGLVLAASESPTARKGPAARRAPMSDRELFVYVQSFDLMPKGVTFEMFAEFLPVIRSDLVLNDSYAWRGGPPIASRLALFYSPHDPFVTSPDGWSRVTQGRFESLAVDGTHAFGFKNPEFAAVLIRKIREFLIAPPTTPAM